MKTIHGKGLAAMALERLYRDTDGDAFIEAAILFPIMIMVFAALTLLAAYMPTRAALQRATQYAATVIATEVSDTWLFYDTGTMSFHWETNKDNLPNVYAALFSVDSDTERKCEEIAYNVENQNVSSKAGVIDIDCVILNWFLYKEVVVTAQRVFTVPINLSLIGFPTKIPITVTSKAIVQNGDEFVRNIDLAVEFTQFVVEKLGLTGITEAIDSLKGKAASLLGL